MIYKRNTMWGVAGCVVFSVLLVPEYGAIGAAIAMSIGMSVKNILGGYYVYRVHNFLSLPSLSKMKRVVTFKERYEIFTYRN